MYVTYICLIIHWNKSWVELGAQDTSVELCCARRAAVKVSLGSNALPPHGCSTPGEAVPKGQPAMLLMEMWEMLLLQEKNESGCHKWQGKARCLQGPLSEVPGRSDCVVFVIQNYFCSYICKKNQKLAVILSTLSCTEWVQHTQHKPTGHKTCRKLRLWDSVRDAKRQCHCRWGEQWPLVGSEPKPPKELHRFHIEHGCPSSSAKQPSEQTVQVHSAELLSFFLPSRPILFLCQPQTKNGVSTQALWWNEANHPEFMAYSTLSLPKWNAVWKGRTLS